MVYVNSPKVDPPVENPWLEERCEDLRQILGLNSQALIPKQNLHHVFFLIDEGMPNLVENDGAPPPWWSWVV